MGFIWKNSLPVSSVVSMNSERIVAIQLSTSSHNTISIIGVYLLTSDYPITYFKDILGELENAIYALQQNGPVIVMGDFNAHKGQPYSERAQTQTNSQGQLLLDMIDRTGHYAASLVDAAKGPVYTFSNGNRFSTVDYCFIDSWAAHIVADCEVLDHHPLNLSDHLAIKLSINCQPQLLTNSDQKYPSLNWSKAQTHCCFSQYQACVSSNLSPILNQASDNYDVSDVENEIQNVVSILHDAAKSSIPTYKHKKKNNPFIHDKVLKQKCLISKSAWSSWCLAGRPRSGVIFQQMKEAKLEVKSHVKKCRAKVERKVIQARDVMFKTKDEHQFSNIHRKRVQCKKLIVNGKPITDEKNLLECWEKHFTELSKSHISETLSQGHGVKNMEALSYGYEDLILDHSFSVEEIEHALKKLKSKRCGGADGLVAEHLKYGGPMLVLWLKRILNKIIQLEKIPPSFKLGMITPVYKGKGRDPLSCNNYRGITLTSVLPKVLEILVLSRLESIFEERGFPHPSQTAYQKGLSCIDAIFSTQEVVLKHIREGDTPYLCFLTLGAHAQRGLL